ncbi:asparagine synthase (glutamine-hydrolyzing) [Candidatus Peregrinibacteria bacterium]|nr:asparagine synthase (glutamine-hydrolyzing) [Candidatus Peregrinibacteria bacterium]
MCGIVGIIGPQEESWISEMNACQFHRGPDEGAVFRDPKAQISLASRRLAIIDLAEGHQPMSTRDGRYTIVFNGEIYNAPELRAALQKKGVEFLTDHSDTEVVLQLYAAEKENMLRMLNGMFAFAIYDRAKQTLFCARDHAGIKPFYYFQSSDRFVFASELKSLLQLPFIKRELNHQSFFHYMSLMYVPGEETIFQGIKRLPAGYALTYDFASRRIKIQKWWTPKFSTDPNSSRDVRDWVSRLREEFKKAVLRWTIADVSVGCSLSGGLDSSSIVGLLAKAGQKVKTYSLGFTGGHEDYWNELPRARLVAQKWQTDHHELVMTPESLLDDLIAMVWHLDEPYGGGLPSWSVFQFMSRDVKVGLTGTGGDELFGNYGKWLGLERFGPFGLFRRKSVVTREIFQKEFFERHYYFPDAEKRAFLHIPNSKTILDTSEMLYSWFQSTNASAARDQTAFTDLSTQLPEEFLMMTDRFSMAHSLEARTPFLDREFMELALSVPADFRTKPHNLKYLLREIVSDLLPRELRHARKKGFVVPLTMWLRGKLRPLAATLLHPDRLKKQGIFRPEFYDAYVLPHLEGRADHTNKVWAALMFQLWHHVFIETAATEKPTYNWKALI